MHFTGRQWGCGPAQGGRRRGASVGWRCLTDDRGLTEASHCGASRKRRAGTQRMREDCTGGREGGSAVEGCPGQKVRWPHGLLRNIPQRKRDDWAPEKLTWGVGGPWSPFNPPPLEGAPRAGPLLPYFS